MDEVMWRAADMIHETFYQAWISGGFMTHYCSFMIEEEL